MHSTKPAQISYVRKCTMNTRVNKMKKYCALLKYFICTDINNQIISNHPGISVNDNSSYKNPATCHSVPSTIPYNHTYKDTPALTHT